MANPDIWPVAVDEWFEWALAGKKVLAIVHWDAPDGNMQAQGNVAAIQEDTSVQKLQGTLNQSIPLNPRHFQEMELEIRKAGDENTTVTVSPRAGTPRVLDNPFGARWWGSLTTSWITQFWWTPAGAEVIDVFLLHPALAFLWGEFFKPINVLKFINFLRSINVPEEWLAEIGQAPRTAQ
jgi:hypothetical protein